MNSTPAAPTSDPQSRPRQGSRVAFWGFVAVLGWVVSIFVAITAWDFVTEKREAIRRRLGINDKSGVIETGLYYVQFQHVEVPREGSYGGLAPLGDGVVHASRKGTLTLVSANRTPQTLPLRVPINWEEFESDLVPSGLLANERFSVKDLAVQPLGAGARLIASFTHWDRERSCYRLRVASTLVSDITKPEMAEQWSDWSTHYETEPCKPMGPKVGGPMGAALAIAGRLAPFDEGRVLLTVGGGMADDSAQMVSVDNPFGKTVLIDLQTGDWRLFTRGHRNAQGLFRDGKGTVYETEHADRGGDELNVLRDGTDYGWPSVTYGTSYGSMSRPANPRVGQHEGFEKPLYAWLPSIGVSQLVGVEKPLFELWSGDLLVTSLRDQAVFRVRLDETAVRYAEPIPIGYRLRDIIETVRGEIVLLADGGPLIYLTPLAATALDGTGNPLDQGRVLAAQCAECHSLAPTEPDRIGPSLWGVVGRDVASRSSYPYSTALRNLGGSWTKSRLRAFLKAPGAYAPGTSMVLSSPLSDAQADAIVEYLASLR